VVSRLDEDNRESILVQIYEKLKAQKGVTQEKIFLQLRRYFRTDEIDDSIDSGAIDLEKPDDWDAFDREIFAKFKEAKAKPSASRKRKSADASDAEQGEVAEEDETDALKLFGKAVTYGEKWNFTFTMRNGKLTYIPRPGSDGTEFTVKPTAYVFLKHSYEKTQELKKKRLNIESLRAQLQAEQDSLPEVEKSAHEFKDAFERAVEEPESEEEDAPPANAPAPPPGAAADDEPDAPGDDGAEEGLGQED